MGRIVVSFNGGWRFQKLTKRTAYRSCASKLPDLMILHGKIYPCPIHGMPLTVRMVGRKYSFLKESIFGGSMYGVCLTSHPTAGKREIQRD